MPAADAEVAADQLWAAGASAVGEEPRGGVVVLTADLDACPPPLAGWPHHVATDDGAWRDGWRPFAKAVVAGPFVVRPPWVAADVGPGQIELVLDAGRAFGTGAHPSTTLALRALADLVRPATAATVLDVGCGSGALAIGAALLGADHVLAVDIDPEAVRATNDNAGRNDVGGRIDVATAAAEEAAGTFDVVVANLGAPLVFDLADHLLARLTAGGALVLSGMLGDLDERVRAAYPAARIADRTGEDGWTCTVLRRLDSVG